MTATKTRSTHGWARQRWVVALTASLLVHALAFSIRFVAPPPQPGVRHEDPLQVLLVNARQTQPPAEAKAIAQAPLEGGGEATQAVTPTSPTPPLPEAAAAAEDELLPALQNSEAATIPAQDTPAPVPPSTPEVLTAAEPAAPPAPPPSPKRERHRDKPSRQKTPAQTHSVAAPEPLTHQAPASAPLLDPLAAAQLAASQLRAEIAKEMRAIAERPRKRFVGVTVKEHHLAQYLEDWRRKVERVGTLNYPTEARGRIYGSLILRVAINAQGEAVEVQVVESSGQPILDDAAKKIVRLASPYAKFTPEMKKEFDILVITRRWTFTRDARLATR